MSKASELFPDPDGPVTTERARRGSSTVIPFRLCCLALRMTTSSTSEARPSPLRTVVVVLAVYGENVQAVVRTLLHLEWGWLFVGLGLASMDWIGGGTRLWVVARHVQPGVRLRDMVIAGPSRVVERFLRGAAQRRDTSQPAAVSRVRPRHGAMALPSVAAQLV